jgi:hypothetical protein
MSIQSAAGQRAWRERAGRYPDELREQIEREAAARFARWQASGRPPLWFRIKRALRRAWPASR